MYEKDVKASKINVTFYIIKEKGLGLWKKSHLSLIKE